MKMCQTLFLSIFAFMNDQADTCQLVEKDYASNGFDRGDFQNMGQGMEAGNTLELSQRPLDLENLKLGLEQPFYVDFLSEGGAASSLFGFFFLDIDTDKDGTPDFYETGPAGDLDGDGLPNSQDNDDDGDGILDQDDTVPAGIIAMPASFFQNGQTAIANSMHGNYWQFVPNSLVREGEYEGYFEHPGAYLYVDNNANKIPDVLEYAPNKMPPYVTDKGHSTMHPLRLIPFKGLLGNDWIYQGTPGSTTDDKFHWTGSTIFYIADDDSQENTSRQYSEYLPYRGNDNQLLYRDSSGKTDAAPDYLIYGTNNPNNVAIPEVLTEANGNGDRRFVVDDRGQEMFRYRWFEASVSGERELIFFLTVFWSSGGADVQTYFSKSVFNPDPAPHRPERNQMSTGDQFGQADKVVAGIKGTNWFPHHRNMADLDDLAARIWGVEAWSDVATIPAGASQPPKVLTGSELKAKAATQEWVDKWENLNFDRRVIQYRALSDWFSNTSVDANNVINGRYQIDMSLEGDSSIIRAYQSHMVHLMVGAPSKTKNAWLLGWEDLFWGGDRDYEDVVFYVKRRAGGELTSLDLAKDLRLDNVFDGDYSISQVNFTFEDNFVDANWGAENRYIAYFYRLSQNDKWILLLGGADNEHHKRIVDKFQPAFGGKTTLLNDGHTVRRQVSIPIEERRHEFFWKVQMGTDNADGLFQPKVSAAKVGFQALIHDFYYNGAVIPNSNINYISAHESPDYGWYEPRNRGHLYALQTFFHGNPPILAKVGDNDSPERTPSKQPVSMVMKDLNSEPTNLYKWDAGVTMNNHLQAGSKRTIYTYLADNAQTVANLSNKRLVLNPDESPLPDLLVASFDLSSDKTTANVWVDNYHNPAAKIRNPNAAALWLINWVHGRENPIISDSGVESSTVVREWVLGGLNRSSPTLIRAPGRPSWLARPGIPIADKRSYLNFAKAQANLPTRLIIGAESGLIHCIDAGKWVGKPKTDPREVYRWADGHYSDYGTGKEMWALLPGHLLDDIKFNYTHASDVTAKSDATAVAVIAKDVNTWKRVLVFVQGYKAGNQPAEGSDRYGNVVWALDLTDVDNPLPLWQRSDPSTQDIVNPVAIGWMMIQGSPRWAAVYPSGGSPIEGHQPAFHIVDLFTGASIHKQTIGSATGSGLATMLGTPALLDTDGDGFVDHVFGTTSEGFIFAFDTSSLSLNALLVPGKKFYLAPNIDIDLDGNVKVIAVSGDDPLTYDQPPRPFTNHIFYYTYLIGQSNWAEVGTIDLPINHKAFSRPKLVGNQLVLGTTTGDTFNFCDADPNDSGSLLLYDLDQIGSELVLEYEIKQFGSVLAPIVVANGRVLAHASRSEMDAPNAKGSVHGIHKLPDAKDSLIFKPAGFFGVASWQDDLIQNLKFKK